MQLKQRKNLLNWVKSMYQSRLQKSQGILVVRGLHSKHSQNNKPAQSTTSLLQSWRCPGPWRAWTCPDRRGLRVPSHLFGCQKVQAIWKSSFWEARFGDPPLPAILLYIQLIGKVQRQGAACSLGHSAGLCTTSSCPGTPRWGQNLHLPSGKALAITTFSTLDILPADFLTACVQEQLSAWAFLVGKHMENIWFWSVCIPNCLDSMLSSPVYLFTCCHFNL